MHHYGEDHTTAKVDNSRFEITLENHLTAAKVTVSGPVRGVFEDEEKVMDQASADDFGRKLAHFFREALGETQLRAG